MSPKKDSPNLNLSFDSENSQHLKHRETLREAKKSTFSKLASIKSMAHKLKKTVKVNVSNVEAPELDKYPGEKVPKSIVK